MSTLVINTNKKSDLKMILDFLKGLNISPKVYSDDEKEDIVLSEILKNIDRTETVSREEVMAALD
jgi:hypothetical protein